jgi:Domain of unknown function (DUF4389)
MAAQVAEAYPVQFSVAYPDGPLNRLTTFFRLFVAIPILWVFATVAGGTTTYTVDDMRYVVAGTGGTLVFGPLLMILFRQKYPRWWFDWNLELQRFSSRVSAFLLLLRDEYPSTDDQQAVRLDFPYPDVPRDLNRWLPLVKWLLALPHYLVLALLGVAVVVAVVVAWFAILVTGRYPRGLFDFVVGAMRWGLRVAGYAVFLVTDRYPPFRLAP